LTTVYKEFDAWQEDVSKVKKFDDLPKNCQKYINFIKDFLRLPIEIISVSPECQANIIKS